MFSFEDAERVAADFQTQADALPSGDEKSDLVRKAGIYRALAEMKRFLKPKIIDKTIEKTTDKTD